jgi:lysozyme
MSVNNYAYSPTGIALTKSFEQCRLKAYQDSGGVWSVGWGDTGPDIVEGTVWTQAECDLALTARLAEFVANVNHYVTEPINQNQFDALVDFDYNDGQGALEGSTLLRLVNQGQFSAAATQFGLWIHDNGKVLEGLVRRRAAEQRLFMTPEATR